MGSHELTCNLVLFLWQAYSSNYVGNAKINRLIFIAEKTTDSALALSALKIAADDLKKVEDHHIKSQYLSEAFDTYVQQANLCSVVYICK